MTLTCSCKLYRDKVKSSRLPNKAVIKQDIKVSISGISLTNTAASIASTPTSGYAPRYVSTERYRYRASDPKVGIEIAS